MSVATVIYEEFSHRPTNTVARMYCGGLTVQVPEEPPCAGSSPRFSALPYLYRIGELFSGSSATISVCFLQGSEKRRGALSEPGSAESSSADSWESSYVPRTELGRKLLRIRINAIAGGLELLTEDEVLEGIKRRRGEGRNDDTHLR